MGEANYVWDGIRIGAHFVDGKMVDGGTHYLPEELETVTLHGDGIGDDAAYLQAKMDGRLFHRIQGGEDGEPGHYWAAVRLKG